MVGAKLTSPGKAASYWRTECRPKHFHEAFRDFENFFYNRTGIAWDDRCDGLPHDESKFKYHAPLLGRPVGRLPYGKTPPEFPKEDEAVEGENGDVEMPDAMEEGLIYDTDSEVEDKYEAGSSIARSKRSSNSSRTVISISISSSGSS
jgi:hypothetical protein